MPREQITRGLEIWTPSGTNPDGSQAYIVRPYENNMQGGDGDEARDLPVFSVGWDRDQPDIQLVISVDMAWMEAYVDGYRKNGKDGKPATAVVHASIIDRREANHLISTVRRARNAVFGTDE